MASEGAALAPRDRAFARLLVATVLRRLGEIDHVLAGVLAQPLDDLPGGARDALRLGAAQLLFLKTPAHAAVDGAVDLVGKKPLKGVLNAVLRRLAKEGAPERDAPRLNTPDWLWRSWTAQYGEDTARAIATAHLAEPPLDLSVKDHAAAWVAKLGGTVPLPGTVRLVDAGPVEALAGYAEGAWWVQDLAASLPARLLGDCRGRRVLDLCAAPGGKTAQLAAAGAQVVALDRSPARIARLKSNLARLGLAAETVIADASAWQTAERFDRILLDAPCSATGTIRRHPDVARLKSVADVERLADTQRRLLAWAVDLLAPGGVLVYAVCSLEAAEGPHRISSLLESGGGLRGQPIEAGEIGGLEDAITPEGALRTLPCHLADQGGMDGFYAFRLRRD